ncbi:MAG TPA: hypothetical protein VJ875_06925 [Pyrinomonadaceae bacterium]|nr:hypothetical protein [Pyrinomonadaceae bacterium]
MANHSSATTRGETPHVNRTSRTNTIVSALKQRARAVLNDNSIDPQSRAIIRYALETNDPWLARLVRQADASETVDLSEISRGSEADSTEHKIKGLTEMICCGGEQSTAALLVLMATLGKATDPNAIANTVKHLAFTRSGELNVYGIVDA